MKNLSKLSLVCISLTIGLISSQAFAVVDMKRAPSPGSNPLLQHRNPQMNKKFLIKLKKDTAVKKTLSYSFKKKNFDLSFDQTNAKNIQILNKKFGVKNIKALYRRFQHDDQLKAREKFSQWLKKVQSKRKTMGLKVREKNADAYGDPTSWYVVELDKDQPIYDFCRQYKELDIVESCEPVKTYHLLQLPNDTYVDNNQDGIWDNGTISPEGEYPDLWGLKNIHAIEVWPTTKGKNLQGDPIIVGVVDTGLDYTHPDIIDNVWGNESDPIGDIEDSCDRVANPDIALADDDCNGLVDDYRGWDFIDNDNNPMDEQGHGTHVSGTIAAIANNNEGIAGVAPEALIMPLKVFNAKGEATIESIADAILYAAEKGAKVMNNSWGCGCGCSSDQQILDNVKLAYDLDVAVIFASGNEECSMDNEYPQTMPEVLAVGAVDHLDKRTDFSNYGNNLDVAAPGGDSGFIIPIQDRLPGGPCLYLTKANILSLRGQNTDVFYNPDNEACYLWGDAFIPVGDENAKYIKALGTSMAAPHASGVAALVRAAHPEYTNFDTYNVLRASADDVETIGFDIATGWGRINALKAIDQEPKVLMKMNASKLNLWDESTQSSRPPYPGETAQFGLTVENLWIPAHDISITVATTNPNITIVNGDAHIDTIDETTSNPEFIIVTAIVSAQIDVTVPVEISVTLTEASGLNIQTTFNVGYAMPFPVNPPTFKSGWPVNLSNLYWWPDNPTIANLNNDNTKEIVFNESKQIRIIKPDGTPGGASPTSAFTEDYIAIFSAGDLDNDGDDDLVTVDYPAYGDTKLDGVLWDGEPGFWRLDPTEGVQAHSIPIVADLDNNGSSEVVFTTLDYVEEAEDITDQYLRKIYVLNGDRGTSFSTKWPMLLREEPYYYTPSFMSSPAVADLDSDKDLEILIPFLRITQEEHTTWYQDTIAAFHHDGTPVENWTYPNLFGPAKNISAGDIDNDGHVEFLVTAQENTINIFDHTGNIIRSLFPTDDPEAANQIYYFREVSLGDLDDDGDLEIAAVFGNSKVYIFHNDGTLMMGWPQPLRPNLWDCQNILLADVSGDGLTDVIIPTMSSYEAYEHGYFDSRIFAWHANGEPVEGFPKETRDFYLYNASIADIDSDNRVELVLASSQQLMWNTNEGKMNVIPLDGKPSAIEWGTKGYDYGRSQYYQKQREKFLRGDANSDGIVNIADAIFTLTWLFANGTEAKCHDAADSNDDGYIDVSDAVRTLLYLFSQSGITLLPPTGQPGGDPTPDNLRCLKGL